MILPIEAFGSTVLREKCKEISEDHPNLSQLIADMHETMYTASGVGLAAPQINISLIPLLFLRMKRMIFSP